jgi:hypothetical protein
MGKVSAAVTGTLVAYLYAGVSLTLLYLAFQYAGPGIVPPASCAP